MIKPETSINPLFRANSLFSVMSQEIGVFIHCAILVLAL